MAAPLSFPYGCRNKFGSMLGRCNGNPRLQTYVHLRAGIFFGAEDSVFLLFLDFSVKPIV